MCKYWGCCRRFTTRVLLNLFIRPGAEAVFRWSAKRDIDDKEVHDKSDGRKSIISLSHSSAASYKIYSSSKIKEYFTDFLLHFLRVVK